MGVEMQFYHFVTRRHFDDADIHEVADILGDTASLPDGGRNCSGK